MHSLLGRLKRVGIAIYPYHLVREQLIPAKDLPANIEPRLDSLTTGFLSEDEMDSIVSDLQKFRQGDKEVFEDGQLVEDF